MIHLPEPRLPELLLDFIVQDKIILTTIIISRVHGIENHCHLMHNPAVRWRKGKNK
jgi:hypothetical protein